jgi:hypothetical protein
MYREYRSGGLLEVSILAHMLCVICCRLRRDN